MKITSKGQVTIPIEIREQLGLLPQTEVVFKITGKELRLIKTKENHGRGKNIVERMRGKGTIKMTTDEIMELTRG
ncbi:MAG: AbrB/MazE/SpoVT family DNA-binding domain-containing protein [Proteobacteria bacterium]|nr:AbrB/MazE/SpoVT family DNA-binding domain-containing protein [Pseudomonadota bacterium]